MPLTSNKQSWQHVDKVLEIVEFDFAHRLSPAEKDAFEYRAHAFTR